MASSKETYCLCGQPYNIGQFMIECDCCREWFHGSCVDVKIYQSDDIDKYHCPKCAQTYGPSVLKIPTNNHRADRYELGAETRASQTGSPAWVRALAARPLRPAPPALARLQPRQFTEEFVRDNGFTRPILFTTSEGLEMETPNPATFSARSVLRFCGKNHEVEVIDVRRQTTLRMPLGDFVEYFETPPDLRGERVLNVLSLEFSDTNMAPLVEPPGTIRRLDWASSAWPAAEAPPRPAVQKYCLMSAAGSYTDFHVDFGGTAVWYHVMHGGKIFYLIPPTSTNLALYQQWSASNNQNERFFGDMVEWYGTAELCAGQTLCIPGGWIHAVLTPQDTLVFGGNLLHSYSIEMQLQIYEIERRVETPIMLRYPLFEAMHWYAGAHLLTMLRRHNEETQDEDFTLHEVGTSAPAPLPPLLLRGVRILATALKEWHALKSTDSAKRDNVPKCLNSGQLVRELCKELRTLEKRSASAANKDKDFKIKNHISPNKAIAKKQPAPKKSLKLTLPKPIMHMAQPDEFVEEKIYADKFYIENKEVVYDSRYPQGIKYANGLQDTKYIVESKEPLPEKYTFQHYEEPVYHDPAYDRQDKKMMKISASPPREDQPPPPYSLPEHSILKSHLVRTDRPALKPIHQWTISKKDLGYQEEQILFTNENLQANMRVEQDINYGPGMYSAEDIQQDYQYSEAAKPGSYQPEYGYPTAAYSRLEAPMQTVQQAASYAPMVPDMNGYHALPSYDAAIAQQYPANNYVIEEQKPPAPRPVRRSERPVRRRVSHTYDYEDGDLYIDDTPAPRRRKQRPKPYNQRNYIYQKPPAPRPVRRSERPVRRRVSHTYDYEDGDLYIDDTPAPRRRKQRPKPYNQRNYIYQKPPAPRPVRRSERPVRRRVSHTYDYEDGDLYIDDTPAPRRRKQRPKPYNQQSNSYRAPAVAPPRPANGIESLIQASVLAEEDPPDHTTEDAAVAVAGMLSISERYEAPPRTFGLASDEPDPPDPPEERYSSNQRYEAPPRTFGLASDEPDPPDPPEESSASSRGNKRVRKPAPRVEDPLLDDEDVIKEVHRDEEYVYPSLEMSSDEDEEWTSSRRRRNSRNRVDSRSKGDKDESWSPRARLGRLVPRLRGPARAGVRRECVRAALHAAAHQPAPAQAQQRRDQVTLPSTRHYCAGVRRECVRAALHAAAHQPAPAQAQQRRDQVTLPSTRHYCAGVRRECVRAALHAAAHQPAPAQAQQRRDQVTLPSTRHYCAGVRRECVRAALHAAAHQPAPAQAQQRRDQVTLPSTRHYCAGVRRECVRAALHAAAHQPAPAQAQQRRDQVTLPSTRHYCAGVRRECVRAALHAAAHQPAPAQAQQRRDQVTLPSTRHYCAGVRRECVRAALHAAAHQPAPAQAQQRRDQVTLPSTRHYCAGVRRECVRAALHAAAHQPAPAQAQQRRDQVTLPSTRHYCAGVRRECVRAALHAAAHQPAPAQAQQRRDQVTLPSTRHYCAGVRRECVRAALHAAAHQPAPAQAQQRRDQVTLPSTRHYCAGVRRECVRAALHAAAHQPAPAQAQQRRDQVTLPSTRHYCAGVRRECVRAALHAAAHQPAPAQAQQRRDQVTLPSTRHYCAGVRRECVRAALHAAAHQPAPAQAQQRRDQVTLPSTRHYCAGVRRECVRAALHAAAHQPAPAQAQQRRDQVTLPSTRHYCAGVRRECVRAALHAAAHQPAPAQAQQRRDQVTLPSTRHYCAGVRRECVRAALHAAAHQPAPAQAQQRRDQVTLPSTRHYCAGVRRECVRAALHAAAHQPAPAQAQQRRDQNAKRAVLATKSRRPPPPVHNTPNNKNSRLKKGMKTAKQRLGKILKIHKMIY
ncbi:uncharacterized protein LOC134751607 [Cydia strobilella]|uniref:uncharacterized protein LOC134751607 n=1 Tax=Cydia strobilella TaxID=1100964 RepID=UPI00300489B9